MRSGVESVSLNCWARHVQYDTFRDLLGPAMNTHLAGNDLLREVFQMGPPPLLRVESKAHKLDRVRGCEGVVKIVSGTCKLQCWFAY